MPKGKVKRVIDGDTFELRSGERVRIAGLTVTKTVKGKLPEIKHWNFWNCLVSLLGELKKSVLSTYQNWRIGKSKRSIGFVK